MNPPIGSARNERAAPTTIPNCRPDSYASGLLTGTIGLVCGATTFIADPAIDALIQSLRVRKCDQYDTECVIRISAVGLGDTVSLLRMVWAYSGGAHGNYSFTAGNWHRGAQGFQPIALADVLNPTSACLQNLNAQIVDALKCEGAPEAPRMSSTTSCPEGDNVCHSLFRIAFLRNYGKIRPLHNKYIKILSK